MSKKTRRTFRYPGDLDDKFIEIATALGKDMSATFVHLLETYLGRDSNQYQFLDDACPALVHLEDGFFCVIKAPQQKRLGDGGADDARKICAAHNEILKRAELQKLLEQGGDAHYHSCGAAGLIHPHDPDLIQCPYVTSMEHVSIKKHCQRRNDGKPCEYLRVHTVQVEALKPRSKR